MGCKLKDLFGFNSLICPPRLSLTDADETVLAAFLQLSCISATFFPTSFVRKNLNLKINNKFFSKSSLLYITLTLYNYLFRFIILYSVFNEHLVLRSLLCSGLVKSEEVIFNTVC